VARLSIDPIIAQAQRPEGRLVLIEEGRWHHVLDRHPEMIGLLGQVIAAIEDPALREPNARPGRKRHFGRGGPLGWIRVVTEFAGPVDRLVTTFPQRRDPRARSEQA
jgi:hypothetical protein